MAAAILPRLWVRVLGVAHASLMGLIDKYEKGQNKMTTAIDTNTDKAFAVKPIAIYESGAPDRLLIADAITGRGMWFGFDLEWHIDLEDGDLEYDAEKIEVHGVTEEERAVEANRKLAEYGLKLGEFDEEAGDRYTLVIKEGFSAASLENVSFKA